MLQTSPLTELLDSINLLTSQLKSFITSTAPSVQGLPDADTADVQSALRNLGSIFSNKPLQEPADRELSEPDCSIPQRVQVLSQAAEHPPTSIVARKVSEVSSTETAISQRVRASQLNQPVPPNTILSGDLYQRKQKSPPLHTQRQVPKVQDLSQPVLATPVIVPSPQEVQITKQSPSLRPLRATRPPTRSDSGWARATEAQYVAMEHALRVHDTNDDNTNRAIEILTQCSIAQAVPSVPVSPDLIASVAAATMIQGHANAIMSACEIDALSNTHYDSNDNVDPLLFGYAYATGDIDLDGTALYYRKLSVPSHPDHLKLQEAHHHELIKLIDVRKNMHFIRAAEIPVGSPITYYNPRCKRKNLDDPDGNWIARVRGTVGGDRCEYTGNRTANVANMTTVKILLNHVISDEDSAFVTADMDDFYLMTGNLEVPVHMSI